METVLTAFLLQHDPRAPSDRFRRDVRNHIHRLGADSISDPRRTTFAARQESLAQIEHRLFVCEERLIDRLAVDHVPDRNLVFIGLLKKIEELFAFFELIKDDPVVMAHQTEGL